MPSELRDLQGAIEWKIYVLRKHPMTDTDNNPILSVAIPTYNHGEYIKRALDSVLSQKVSFKMEIIVGDDGSTDNTRDILLEFKEKHPEMITLLLSEENAGVLLNSFKIYKKCRGKYIATLEGDDYWCYEHKLQKQVDFLENNKDYSGCFHDASIISATDSNAGNLNSFYSKYKYYSQFNSYKTDFFPCDLLQRNIIATASIVFRNLDYSYFFHRFSHIKLSLQWGLYLYVIKKSKFRYFNETWSVYNDHPLGVTKKKNILSFNTSNLEILKILRKDEYYKYFRLDLNRTTLNEYKQILYNSGSQKLPLAPFLKYYLGYLKYTFKLLWCESSYFNYLRKNKS